MEVLAVVSSQAQPAVTCGDFVSSPSERDIHLQSLVPIG
jgi:hypothetical protein